MGSLLLIVYLVPRKKHIETIPSTKEDDYPANSDPDLPSTELPTTVVSESYPKLEAQNIIPEKDSIPNNKNDSSLCNLVFFDSVFNMRLMDVENICKDFIDKLIYPEITNVSFYFIKTGKFTKYMEKNGKQFIEYNQQKERSELRADIIQYLQKKLGAFSSTQLDAVLPLVNENQLFGAIKLQFSVPIKNPEINEIWREIKSFSMTFYETYFKIGDLVDDDDSKEYTDSFQMLLANSFKSPPPQGLCLIKWIRGRNSDLFYSQLIRKLNKFTKHDNNIHKLNDNMFGFILRDTSLEYIQDNIGIFMGELIQDDPTLEFCIGCANISKTHGNFNDWYKSAIQSLKTAVSQGTNKFNFIN